MSPLREYYRGNILERGGHFVAVACDSFLQTKPNVKHPVTVAVINYNTCDYLRHCLRSINGQTDRIIVVDNGSQDASVEVVSREFADIQLVALSTNQGFASAVNHAITACTTPFLLVLNSDTILHERAVHVLASYLADNPHVAVAGPRLVNPDGSLQRSCRRFPGSLAWFFDNNVVGEFLRSVPGIERFLLHAWSYDRVRPVPWVIGAALALRVQAVRDVGCFDEGFFLYCEEIDLLRRLRDKGWQVHFVPQAEVTHVGGASSPEYGRSEPHLIQSSLRFYDLHYGVIRVAILRALLRCKLGLRLIGSVTKWAVARNGMERERRGAGVRLSMRLVVLKWR